jgi:hypothetical protein
LGLQQTYRHRPQDQGKQAVAESGTVMVANPMLKLNLVDPVTACPQAGVE